MDLRQQFVLPELRRWFPTTFAQRAHPDATALEAEVFAILNELQVDHAVVSALRSARLGDSYGRMLPDASQDGLRLCVMNSTMVRINEVWWEERDADGGLREPRIVTESYDRVCAVLAGAPSTRSDDVLSRFVERFRDRMDEFDTAWRSSRYPSLVEKYFDSTVWELDYRRRSKTPPLAVYRDLRRHNTMATAWIELCQFVCRAEIPNRLRSHPVIEQLHALAANCATYVNDLFGLAKELHEGTTTNLVLVLQHELGCSLQEAVNAAVDTVNRETAAYLDLRARLPFLGIPVTPQLTDYFDRLEMLVGNAFCRDESVPIHREHDSQ